MKRVSGVLVGWILVLAVTSAWGGEDFSRWLADLRQEALAQGISRETVEGALTGVEPIDRVIELDRRQPEFTLTTGEYLDRVVSERRVERGRELYRENSALLEEIAARYGVQPRYVLALWGIETNFGSLTGGFPVIDALATLAWEGRRGDFFRRQLLQALRILDEGHIAAGAMTGSWAGAMGQVQFMPSSFASFAVDYDGDGRKDIWTTRGDALASAANYLSKSGWETDEGWGLRVRLPEGFDAGAAGLDRRRALREWRELGLKEVEGPADRRASLLLPEGATGPAFLVFENFRTLLRWNRSHSFALAVGLLADRIAAGVEGTSSSATLDAGTGQPEKKGGFVMAKDPQVISFNINAELYENDYGDLAIRFEGDKVFEGVGNREGSLFSDEADRVIRSGELPEGWSEMSPREILYGHGWHLVGSMGYLDGDPGRPAIELEVDPNQLGTSARRYLQNAL